VISLGTLLCMDQILSMVESNPKYGQVAHGVIAFQIECEVDLVHGFNNPFDVLVHCFNQWWECIHSLTLNAYVFGVIPSAIDVVENVVKSIDVVEMLKKFTSKGMCWGTTMKFI